MIVKATWGSPVNINMGYGSSVSGFGILYTDGYKGLPTGKVTAQLTGTGISGYLYSAFYYDDRGRIIQSRSTNHLGGLETEYFAYNLIGDVLKKKHVHTKGAISQEELYTYDYDHARRLIKTRHKLGNNAEVVLSENTYNDLGQLATSRKHGRSDLATTYTYNVRSWLKSVSTGDLFSQTLYYNESYGGSTGRYNGNISAMSWKATSDGSLRGYAFSYDRLSRLTAANYLLNGSVNTNYNTSYTYDKHGNLKTLMRYGKTVSSAYGVMDNLTCTYTGNQLYNVSDSGTDPLYSGAFNFMDGSKNSSREYKYDTNGNMQEDYNKKITKIQYNPLNLPIALQFTNGNRTDYLYSSDGMKRRVTYSTAVANVSVPMGEIRPLSSNQVSTTHTVDYCGNVIYEGGNLSKILTEEGYITLSGSTPTYHYYLKDHQGNNRVVTYWNGSKWFVEQVNHYYPFGGVFAEGTAVSNQAYKYNGKELDQMHGVDWYDYGARMHDAALGRFTTMDPLAEKYYSVSPYAYCANSPFNNVDLDGKSWYSYNQDGKTIYEWNINIRSQEDLDKIRENAIYIGNTHSDGDTYYSLFGNKYSIDSKEGKTMEKIDEALINYSQASLKYDYYGNLILGSENVTNFDIGEYPQNNSLNLSEDTYFSFQAEGGSVRYFKVSEGVDNKAKFGGFGCVTKGQIRGQGNRGAGNLKDGIPIYFERQNTLGNIVQRSAQIVFPTQKAADTFI